MKVAQIDDYVHTVGRAIQPADPLSSEFSRLKRRPQRGPQARIGRPTRAPEYSPGFRTHYASWVRQRATDSRRSKRPFPVS